MNRKPVRHYGLCWRCQYRAEAMEGRGQRRMECGSPGTAVGSCYMFKPTYPLVMRADKGDRRPVHGPAMISARAHAVRELNCICRGIKVRGGVVAYWDASTEPVTFKKDEE